MRLSYSQLIKLVVPATLIFFSGACSLTYQIIWERTLRFLFSGDTICAAIISGVFLLGLGIGALIAGRPWKAPLRMYGILEIATGLFAVLSYTFLTQLHAWINYVFPVTLDKTSWIYGQLAVASIIFLLLPCSAMGASLPLIYSSFVAPEEYRSWKIGFFYGVNIMGAAAGCLLAPLVFLRHLDIPSILGLTGCFNVLIGVLLLLLSCRHDAADTRVLVTSNSKTISGPEPIISIARVYIVCFVSGGVALAMEIVMLRHFYIIFPSSPYVYPLVLLLYLSSMGFACLALTNIHKRALIVRRLSLFLGLAVLTISLGICIQAWNIQTGRLFPEKIPLDQLLDNSATPLEFIFNNWRMV
ncbi:MAG: hypothetical protein KKH68_09860, partial [Proteobacteria bacterium]|nr:hypothetical protein [Pseudomonadota bacterium]